MKSDTRKLLGWATGLLFLIAYYRGWYSLFVWSDSTPAQANESAAIVTITSIVLMWIVIGLMAAHFYLEGFSWYRRFCSRLESFVIYTGAMAFAIIVLFKWTAQ